MKNAAIVGCGNIAGFLDSPTDRHITTHAHAYREFSETSLVAVCDPDNNQSKKLIRKWGKNINAYTSVKEMLKDENIDVLSICSPTQFHYEAMVEALKNESIQTILCEKPFVQNQDELNTLITMMKSSNKKVIINFMRRYDPSLQKLSSSINSKELGELLRFNGKFTKGLYHNGSHMLDLIEMLCGNINSLISFSFNKLDNDYYGDFFIKTDHTKGVIQNFTGDSYALFELEIIFSKGRVLIKDSGHTIHIETAVPSEQYDGYFSLQRTKSFDDTMHMNLLNTLDFSLSSPHTDEMLAQHLKLSQKLLDIRTKGPQNLCWDHL